MTSEDIKHHLIIISLAPKHARIHEAHPPRVKKKFCLDSNDFGFIWAGVATWSVTKQTSDIIRVVSNKLTTVWAPTNKQKKQILVSWQFSGVTKYGSGWRKDLVNQCLEFGWHGHWSATPQWLVQHAETVMLARSLDRHPSVAGTAETVMLARSLDRHPSVAGTAETVMLARSLVRHPSVAGTAETVMLARSLVRHPSTGHLEHPLLHTPSTAFRHLPPEVEGRIITLTA